MKVNSSIYLIAAFPHYNPEVLPLFEAFNIENSRLLYSAIDLNYNEILSPLNVTHKIKFCFDERDKEYLPLEFLNNSEPLFYDSSTQNIFKILGEKYFDTYKNNFCLFSDSIGVNSADIIKTFNLLTIEDDAVVEGKSITNNVIFLGMNHNNSALLEDLRPDKLTHNEFLERVCRQNNFIYSLNGFLSIHNMDDFKILYNELSKKESLNYCSQKIHEKFTHLFIEYKELLK